MGVLNEKRCIKVGAKMKIGHLTPFNISNADYL